jgi:hypothetical protein
MKMYLIELASLHKIFMAVRSSCTVEDLVLRSAPSRLYRVVWMRGPSTEVANPDQRVLLHAACDLPGIASSSLLSAVAAFTLSIS